MCSCFLPCHKVHSGRDKVISSTRAKPSLQLHNCFPGEGRGNLSRWERLFLINNEAFPKQLSRKHSSGEGLEHSQGVVLPFVALKPGSAQGVATQLLTSPSGLGSSIHSFKLVITMNSYPQSRVCAQERGEHRKFLVRKEMFHASASSPKAKQK